MIVCAGYGTLANPYSDLWELSLGASPAWTQLPFPNNFYRLNATAVHDPTGDKMILFGGYNNATVGTNDAWTVPLGATSELAPLTVSGPLPLPRASHTAVFDPVSRRMLVFGGFNAVGLNGSTPGSSDVYALELPGAGVLSAPPLPAGTSMRMAPAYPDPAPAHVTIEFALAASAHASLRVYDVAGRTVRTLVDGALAAGPHRISWDRRDDQGAPADAGLYFYELRTSRGRITGRVALVR